MSEHALQYDDENTELENAKEFLTFFVAEQMFGIPVLQVQDVLRDLNVTKVPLARPEVAGTLNLRGRIVTAIDLRVRLDINNDDSKTKNMSVVVEHDDELFSLLIDRVGDVLSIEDKHLERNPATLDSKWGEISDGIYRLENRLMVILDVSKLLNSVQG